MAGAKTQDLGPRRSSDRTGAWHLCKNSKSAIKLLQMVLATPHYPPNAKTPRFGLRNRPKRTPHELQHTAGTTSPSVSPWLFAGAVWEVACSSEKPRWAHDTAKTELSGGNGTWDAAGGHLNGTRGLLRSRALTRRSSTQRNLLNKGDAKQNNRCRNAKHIHSPYLVALWMRVFKGLRICQVACDQK
jgi:hypothetical protein